VYIRQNKLMFVGCRTLAETCTAYHLNDAPLTIGEGPDCIEFIDEAAA
jgi:hypothetical protein